jgi:hypothetical protein
LVVIAAPIYDLFAVTPNLDDAVLVVELDIYCPPLAGCFLPLIMTPAIPSAVAMSAEPMIPIMGNGKWSI